MSDTNVVMECQEYEAVPEEVVETSYMCGECFLLFPTTEEFNAHQCQDSQVDGVESVVEQDGGCREQGPDPLDGSENNPCVWEAQESEAAMEEAVANILGEKMKKMAPQRHLSARVEFERTLTMPEEPSIEHTGIMDQQMDSVVEHTVENKETVEIPSANVYMYDNPIYLNRLMKDNTFGRRVRHDAPYRLRLGPWDNKSSRLLIKLLKEYPKAYFILDKECKRTEAWEMIRNKMSEVGHQFTVLQIRMRWRELVKTYRTTMNYNDMQNVRRYCQFFEELNDLFGVWDYTATVILIRQMELHGSKRLGQNGGTRMRFKIWNHIRIVLEAQGFTFTADQVQGRWSTLVNLYQRMVENNSKLHTEKITMAFREHMERVFNYVPERNSKWRKIMEKRGKTPRTVKRNWTHPIERELLTLYRDRIYRFNNEHINKNDLWVEIVQHLKEETDYITTVEKARIRFSELTKQFTTVEQHNSQSGTIRRECKHHELLSEIYSVYNYWPHDKSTIKLNKSNALRMRQVNAQLAWSESQSRALLQLYPQVLVSHISSGDHQPIEEFWLQLAKAYLNTQGDRKQCYEIEEHIALLRRGFQSRNPFPFCSEMQLLDGTEVTLGFSPDPVVTEKDQLIPYWSHNAAILLLDLLIMYRQDGIKNIGLFEMISRDLGNHGYRYTGEECRVYYFLLRQLYTNRLRTLKRNRELLKPFPYMDKMAEVDTVVSLPRFVETNENCQIIISAASSLIQSINGESEQEKFTNLITLFTNIRLHLRQKNLLHPLPSVKKVGQVLKDAITDLQNDQVEVVKLRSILDPVSRVLNLATERTPSNVSLKPILDDNREKIVVKRVQQPKYSVIQWTESNLQIMLEVIKEWRLLCHDTAEFEVMLGVDNPVWREVASRLKANYKLCPNKCQERFSQLCREYKSVVAFNARLESDEPAKTVACQELLQSVLAPLVFHEAEIDPRDEWGICEDGEHLGHYETVELLFIVKELGSRWPKIDWEMVRLFMNASGYKVDAEYCKSRFEELFKNYEAAVRYNQNCSLKNRKKSSFYFKIRSLFLNHEMFDVEPEPAIYQKMDVDEFEVQKTLVQLLKTIKKSYCHSIPRRPLLVALARLLDDHFMFSSPTFRAHQVWQLMVQLHVMHQDAFEVNVAVDFQRNLGEVWQNHPSPLVAYNLLALPLPHWKLTNEWSVEEVYLLIDAVINWELQPRSLQAPEKTISQLASESLQDQGYRKSPKQCYEQWQYLASTYNYGGYRNFGEQLCVLHLISPTLLQIKPSGMQVKLHVIKCASNSDSPKQRSAHASSQSQKVLVQGASASGKKQKNTTPKEVESSSQTISSNKDEQIHKGGLSMLHSKSSVKKLKVCTKVKDLSKESASGTSGAPGNVVSYVRINVPKQIRSVQVSTDELNDENSHDYSNTIEDMKVSEVFLMEKDDETMAGSMSTIKIEDEFRIGQKRKQCMPHEEESILVVNDVKEEKFIPNLSEQKTVYYFKCNPDSQEEKTQVDVLKMTLGEKSKIVECRTRGIAPRTIMLHYPLDYNIHTDMTQVYVPRLMAFPESVEYAKKRRPYPSSKVHVRLKDTDLGLTLQEIKSEVEDSEKVNYLELNVALDDTEMPQNKFVLCVDDRELEMGENLKSSSSDAGNKQNNLSKGHEIMELLDLYQNQVCQERFHLMKILQESHVHQTTALKNIFSVFQEIHDTLDS